MIWLVRRLARFLGAASERIRGASPEHLHTARCGEMEAYFYLRSLGYRIVAKNYRSARDHGEIDIIGWDEGVLCFIEVKTHSKLGMVPPEIAVDAAKKGHIRSVARRSVGAVPGGRISELDPEDRRPRGSQPSMNTWSVPGRTPSSFIAARAPGDPTASR